MKTIIRAAIDIAAARIAPDPGFDHALFAPESMLLVRRAVNVCP